MNVTRCIVGTLLLASLALCGCSKPPVEKPDLIVLHTGRLRGNVYPLDANMPLQHYPYIAGYVARVRAEAARSGAEVLLVDLGDSLDGSFAAQVTESENMAAFFNALDYDAIALSNLDATVPPATLDKIEAAVLTPFVGLDGKPAPGSAAFLTRIEKGGIPVELLANFYGDLSPASAPERFPAGFGNASFGVTPLRDYKALGGPGAPGALRLLTWMKLESPETPPHAFLEQLRQCGVDAIIAHRVYGSGQREVWSPGGVLPWEPPVSLNILRDNGGFAIARLDLKRDGDGWKVLRQEIVPMNSNTAPADEATVREIARFSGAIASADAHLADLAAPVPREAILDACLEAALEVPGTDAALGSIQSIRADWPAGPLRASAVFRSLPWRAPLVQIDLAADQLDRVTSELGLAQRRRAGAPEGVLRTTTSQFFGQLLLRRLGLPQERLLATPATSEFDFFVGKLRDDPALLERARGSQTP